MSIDPTRKTPQTSEGLDQNNSSKEASPEFNNTKTRTEKIASNHLITPTATPSTAPKRPALLANMHEVLGGGGGSGIDNSTILTPKNGPSTPTSSEALNKAEFNYHKAKNEVENSLDTYTRSSQEITGKRLNKSDPYDNMTLTKFAFDKAFLEASKARLNEAKLGVDIAELNEIYLSTDLNKAQNVGSEINLDDVKSELDEVNTELTIAKEVTSKAEEAASIAFKNYSDAIRLFNGDNNSDSDSDSDSD
jgi:hypothetical protein